ncbi:MAG: hypothetical protein HWD91_02955 [Marivivens sp.]|uniref:hypothetical protein n=1 Tax=Marivivens sp. TaxID=1978374 RepID=UPI0017B7BE07|nr:hypothetical protein [Marivivens sp.]NVJ94524.1 hypothetical protein [Marivivens sp.]
MRVVLVAAAIALLAASPLAAQTINFGDDASQWSNDGECDDPRFEGKGMTTTPLLDSDIMHDASDCEAAFNAGTIALSASAQAGMKGGHVAAPEPVIVDGINFGDDSGEWSMDGECDDRRFYGSAMASSVSWTYVGADATDCSVAYLNGDVKLWDYNDAKAMTNCAAVDFGDDNGEYPQDMECDDPRFEGPASAMSVAIENLGHDASDCAKLCAFGVVFMRDY